MLKITIEGATFEDLKNGVLNLAQNMGGAVASADTATKPKAAAGKAATTAPAKPDVPDFKTEVSPLILQLADKSRDKAVEVLGAFGVKKGAELKPEQYVNFIAAVKATMEALENDLG